MLAGQADTEGETDVSERFLQQALDHCLEIVFGGNLRSANEKMDPFWVKEAGLMAGRLAKQLGQVYFMRLKVDCSISQSCLSSNLARAASDTPASRAFFVGRCT